MAVSPDTTPPNAGGGRGAGRVQEEWGGTVETMKEDFIELFSLCILKKRPVSNTNTRIHFMCDKPRKTEMRKEEEEEKQQQSSWW